MNYSNKLYLLIFVIGIFCLSLTMGGQTQPVNDEIPKDFKLKMERTPCFGSCLVYTLTVDAKGNVSYKGYKRVFRGTLNEKWLERRKWKISKEQVMELIQAIDESGFFSMSGLFDDKATGCSFSVTDASGVKLDISMGSKKVSLDHYLGCHMCQKHHEFYGDSNGEKMEQSAIDSLCKPYEEHDRKVKKLIELEAAVDRILEFKEHVNEEDN